MDQRMKIMDEMSAAMAIHNLGRDSTANIAILGITVDVRTAQPVDMLNAGMDDIIHKPYRTNDLFEKMNQ